MRAYGLRYEQISGPEWIQIATYDLLASVGAGATTEQVNEMLRSLITERFRLVFHHATRELPLYELVQTKRVKLNRAAGRRAVSAPDNNKGFPEIPSERTTGLWQGIDPYDPTGRVRVTGRNEPVSELVRAIGNQAGRPVVDKTGLVGNYDFVLEYALVPGTIGMLGMPMPGPPPNLAPANNQADDPPPDLTTAIEEQLGLKLKPAKGPLDVMVIDRAERVPIEN